MSLTEQEIDIATPHGAMNTFVVYPESGKQHMRATTTALNCSGGHWVTENNPP